MVRASAKKRAAPARDVAGAAGVGAWIASRIAHEPVTNAFASQKLRQPIVGSSGATSSISMIPIGMYALQAAITKSRFSRVISCASMLGIATTTARKPTPSMMRATSRTS